MKIILIWTLAVAISLVPLGLLFRANPRAIPVGLFAFSGPLIFIVGALGIGGAGAGSQGQANRLLAQWVATLVVVAILGIVSFMWLGGSAGSRSKWVGLSWLTWAVVFFICAKAVSAAENVRRAARYQIEKKEMADPNSDYSKLKARYDKPSPPPVPVLQRVVDAVAERMANDPFKPARFVYFGDTQKPETVAIWAVMSLDSSKVFGAQAIRNGGLFIKVTLAMRERGLDDPASVGVTTEELIEAAGGDSAYFGPDGSRVTPQFDRAHDVSAPVHDLYPPLRRD